jgi:hypothetical protein
MNTMRGPAGPRWSAMKRTVYLHPLTRACAREKELPTVHRTADHRGPNSEEVTASWAGLRNVWLRPAPVEIVEVAAAKGGDAEARLGRHR